MQWHRGLSVFVALIVSGSAATARATEPIPADEFSKLHAMIRPQMGEAKWSEITWLTSLHEARTKAVAEGKPIFVWSASGEPLGCT
jgi:hypothetical protein